MPAAPRSSAALSGSDIEFLAARNAFRSGDAALVDRLYPRLSSSLLEPYVAYYSLHMHLATGRKESSITGCVRKGVKVWQIVEVVIFELLETEAIRKWHHERLSTYGIGSENTRPEWKAIGRELEQKAQGHAVAQVVPEHLAEVRGRRLELIDKTEAAVKARRSSEKTSQILPTGKPIWSPERTEKPR